jgi:hypothetical protein
MNDFAIAIDEVGRARSQRRVENETGGGLVRGQLEPALLDRFRSLFLGREPGGEDEEKGEDRAHAREAAIPSPTPLAVALLLLCPSPSPRSDERDRRRLRLCECIQKARDLSGRLSLPSRVDDERPFGMYSTKHDRED